MTTPGDARAARAAAARRACEALAPLGPVEARSMFGGHGVFLDGAMVGVVIRGDLYLKTDEVNRARFTHAGLPPFVHHAGGRENVTSLYRAPEPVDDWDALAPYAESALDAARRALARRGRRRRG